MRTRSKRQGRNCQGVLLDPVLQNDGPSGEIQITPAYSAFLIDAIVFQ